MARWCTVASAAGFAKMAPASPTMAAPAPPMPAARAEPGASASTDPAWAESGDDATKALQKNVTRRRRVEPWHAITAFRHAVSRRLPETPFRDAVGSLKTNHVQSRN